LYIKAVLILISNKLLQQLTYRTNDFMTSRVKN